MQVRKMPLNSPDTAEKDPRSPLTFSPKLEGLWFRLAWRTLNPKP